MSNKATFTSFYTIILSSFICISIFKLTLSMPIVDIFISENSPVFNFFNKFVLPTEIFPNNITLYSIFGLDMHINN